MDVCPASITARPRAVHTAEREVYPGYVNPPIVIRPAEPSDHDAIWQVLEPTIRAGETYTLPRDLSRQAALDFWFAAGHAVFVSECQAEVWGTYFLRANQQGGGRHVANCGYMTAPHAWGRGLARAMCLHSLDLARERGFHAMQFNFVVATNTRAVRLWESCGFQIVGRLPLAFHHPTVGLVDGFVMYRQL